jgi:predicted DNA-binding protein (UPF0251 family)
MTTTHIPDDAIEAAIEQHDDPEHEDALTAEVARATLDDIQQSIEEYYSEWLDMVDDETVEIVHEDTEAIVLADHSGHAWREELDAAGVEDDVHRTVIRSAHHKAASKLTERSWSASDPFVFEKPRTWQIAEQHVRRTIAKLARESGSVARGADRWAVERQDMRLKEWGDEDTGTDRPHQTISKNARRGREEAER